MRAPAGNLLEVENLFVSFATGHGAAKVLDGVNLTIRTGEIMGLVGESGCGKTTLANAILGILAGNARTEAGSILYLIRAVLRGSATAGDGPNGGILLDRADSPGATDSILRRERQNRTVPRRKGRNRCPVLGIF